MNRIEAEVVADSDEDQPLPSLRDAEPGGVEQFCLNAIALVFHRGEDQLEIALSRAFDETGDVLGDERPRLNFADEPRELKEEVIDALLGVGILFDLAPSGVTLTGG